MDSNQYNALISPDTYGYLDKMPEDELLSDPILEEQEAEDWVFDEDEEEEPAEVEEPLYAHDSLFSEDLLAEGPEENLPELSDEEAGEEAGEEQPGEIIEEQVPCVEPEEVEESQAIEEEVPEVVEAEGTEEFEEVSEMNDVPEFLEICNETIGHITAILPAQDEVSQFLEEMERDQQDELAEVIKSASRSFRIDGKDKMFVLPGQDISIAVLSRTSDPMRLIQRLENVGAVMVSKEKTSWTVLMLYVEPDGTISDAETRKVSRDTFNEWQWKTVLQMGERFKSNRR